MKLEPVANLETLSPRDLETQASTARERILRFRTSLSHYFVERERVLDLMVLSALCQEPLLLLGTPGTAKSELVVKFCEALGVPSDAYFEYVLTRFTEPSEIMGPIDVSLLREGRYVRRVAGKLPTATVVFLDEIFKASSAILNALLTVINERKFYQDGVALPVMMKLLFAATNEIPEHGELAALKDRFVLKTVCRQVPDDRFIDLIDHGLEGMTHRELARKPWVEGHANLDDFLVAHRHLHHVLAERTLGPGGEDLRDRHRFFSSELLLEMRRVARALAREDGVHVSDRKLVKLYRLIRAHAWLFHGGAVERSDLMLLSYLGDTREQADLLEEKVPRMLGLG